MPQEKISLTQLVPLHKRGIPDNTAVVVSLLVLFLFSCSPAVWADESQEEAVPPEDLTELSLEELINLKVDTVQGASKYEQKMTEAPAAVTVVTSDDIMAYGYRTLAEILQSVGGMYATTDRQYDFVGIRGFGRPGDYNSRVLLLVDGHRINDNIYDSAGIDSEFVIDVDMIDRVEVIRGPSSSLYGTSAFFGVINVITKSGADLDGFEVSGEGGSYDTYKGRLSYGRSMANGLEMIVSGSLFDSDGQNLYFEEYDDPESNNGVSVGCDDQRYGNLFAKLSYGEFTFRTAYSDREKGIPTGAWETIFNDPTTRVWDSQRFFELEYNHDFADGADVMARLFYDRYDYEGDYLYDWAEKEGQEPYLVLNKDWALGEWWGGEVKYSRRLWKSHRLTAGTEYRYNQSLDQGNYDEEVYLDDRRDSSNWALYLQDEIGIGDQLILNAGLRYDHYETFGSTTNPRVALIYTPLKRTVFKLLYGEAFRAPNAYELYYHDGGWSQKPNPDLEPESIKTYELVVEQYVNEHIRGSVSGYYYKIDDLITEQIDPEDDLLIFENVDRIEARGIELELHGEWAGDRRGRLSYTYQKAEDQMTGEVLDNAPEHLFKFNLTSPLIRRYLFAGLEIQYTGERTTVQDTAVDGFWLVNLNLFNRELVKGLELSAGVYNLLDETYRDPVSNAHRQDAINRDGRNFRIKLTYRF